MLINFEERMYRHLAFIRRAAISAPKSQSIFGYKDIRSGDRGETLMGMSQATT